MNKAELLDTLQKGWDETNAFLASLSSGQKLYPTDAAGWSVKDHVIHMAAWEDGLTGFLDKQDRRAYMGIDEAIWKPDNDDPINEVIFQRYKDWSWDVVMQQREAVHNKLLGQINAMSDEALQGAYGAFNSNSPSKRPITEYITGATSEHYGDHLGWMETIVNDRKPLSKTQLLAKIQKGWDDLNQFVTNLSDAQKTQPTDATGWTVKDHLIHMAVWENGVVALLNKQDRVAQMGVDAATWASDDDDQINAVIQKQHQTESLESVEQQRQTVHNQLIQQIESMSDADLQLPVSDFDPQTEWQNTISGPIIGNTYMHYADHIPWMTVIEAGEKS